MKKTQIKPASERQLSTLIRAGYQESELSGLSRDDASALIDRVASNHWRRPKEETAIVRVSDKDLSERALPMLDNKALDKLAECLDDEDDRYHDRDLREDLRSCLVRTCEGVGEALKAYKDLYGRRGKWPLLLSALRISEATAYRWMRPAIIDVPEVLEKPLREAGICLNSEATAQDRRVVSAAVDHFKKGLSTSIKSPQPIESIERANRAVQQAMEDVVPPSNRVPDPEPEIIPPPQVDSFEGSWEVLESTMKALSRHDPKFYDRLRVVLEKYAPEVCHEPTAA